MKPGDIVRIDDGVLSPSRVLLLVTDVGRDGPSGIALTRYVNGAGDLRRVGDRTLCFPAPNKITVDNDNPEALAAIARLALKGKL